MKFERAIADFAVKLSRKGFPLDTIKKYIVAVKKIFQVCNRIWEDKGENERMNITCREIENYIYWNKNRSDGTKRVVAVQIRAFLRFCSTLNLPVINFWQITIKKYTEKEAKYLNEQEEAIILEALQGENLTLRTSIILMLTTGLRVSEATSITKQQLRSAYFFEGIYQIPIQWKGQKTRAIFLPPNTYELCEKLSNKHSWRSVLGMETQSLQQAIKRFSRAIWIKFTAHSLRHTYLTKLAQKGADLYKIQKIAGHKCIITTSRYLHACNKELAETAKLLLS